MSKEKSEATNLIKFWDTLSKFIIRSLQIIVMGDVQLPSSDQKSNQIHMETIKHTVFESFYLLLDGFEWQIAEISDPLTRQNARNISRSASDVVYQELKSNCNDFKLKFGQFVTADQSNCVDIIKPKLHGDIVLLLNFRMHEDL